MICTRVSGVDTSAPGGRPGLDEGVGTGGVRERTRCTELC